jgi:YVTN family beta-propeller protein
MTSPAPHSRSIDRRGSLLLFLAVSLALATPARADVLVVLNKSADQAALLDPAKGKVLSRIPTGRGPHEVAVSPDGRLAYVSNYGFAAIFRQGERRDSGPGNTISVLDLERRCVRDTFELGTYTMPHGIRVSRDGARLWVTSEATQTVLELDARSGAVLKSWETGQEVSHMVVPTPDEKKLYVANIRSGSVSVITRSSEKVDTIKTGAGAEGIDVSPDGQEVWVGNRADHTLTIIDPRTDRVVANMESGGQMPIRVRFTPDGRQVWVSNATSNTVTVFDVASRQRVGAIPVGAVPVGIEISPDGKRVFVACTNDDRIKVIDALKRRVVATYRPGKEPDGMAWAKPVPAAAPAK